MTAAELEKAKAAAELLRTGRAQDAREELLELIASAETVARLAAAGIVPVEPRT